MVSRKKDVCSPETDFIGIIEGSELSPVTKTGYCNRIRYMCASLKADFFSIVKDYKKSIAWIEANYENATSKKTYLSTALSAFRHCEGLKEQLPAAYKAWFDAFSRMDKAVEERYKRNEPSEKQAEGYVPFGDIEKKRDELEEGTEERLLLGMYTWIYPLRADFNYVRIYSGATVPSHHVPNYLHMATKGCTLVLSEYKTSSTHGVFKKVLPDVLCKEIRASLDKRPREWLFVTSDGKPFEKANSYNRYANRMLARLFGKPLTLSLIRHSFIDTLDFNKLTIAEKEEIALEMRHTTRMQDQYRLIFKKDKESHTAEDTKKSVT